MMLWNPLRWCKSADACVGMYVCAPVDPGPPPGGIVDDHCVPAPVKAVITPAPRSKESSDRHAEAEADRAADHETTPWREENDSRIIVRHHDEAGVYGHDCDVGSGANDNLAVTSQISEVAGFPPLPLDRVHHILLLRQERVSKVGGPVHVGGRHFGHGNVVAASHLYRHVQPYLCRR